MSAAFMCILAALLLAGCAGIGGRGGAAPKESAVRGDELGGSGSIEPEISTGEFEIAEEFARLYQDRGRSTAASVRARLTFEATASDAERRDTQHFVVAAWRTRAVLRRRASDGVSRTAFFARAEVVRGHCAFGAGSFSLDFAERLFAGAGGSASPFSTAFDTGSRRRIAPNTSLFGRGLIGVAVDARRGGSAATLFAGRERLVRGGRIQLGDAAIAGGRVETSLGGMVAGISAMANPADRGRLLVGADVRAGGGPYRAGFEATRTRGGDLAACASLSVRRRGARIGGLFHSIPSGRGCPLGSVAGEALAPAASHGGAVVAAEQKIPHRAAVRATFQRSARTSDSNRKERRVLTVELEKRWKRARLNLSTSSKETCETPLLPFPGFVAPVGEGGRSWGFLASVRPARTISMRLAAKSVTESTGGQGLLVSPSLRALWPGGGVSVSLSYVWYGVSGGSPVCYYYEPSLEGAYPWRSTSRRLDRLAFIIIIKYKGIALSCKVVVENGEVAGGAVETVGVL